MTITALIDRLCCPAYQRPTSPHQHPTAYPLAPQLQGQALHALVESYLRGEPLAAGFNLLNALPIGSELRTEMVRRACNLLSVANQLVAGAKTVETEVPLSLSLTATDNRYTLHGFCDCLLTGTDGAVTVVDWKPGPHPHGLDQLQVKAYLAAVLTARGLERGTWVLYYYDTNGLRRCTAALNELMAELYAALAIALAPGGLRPGVHCTGCVLRKECTASAWTVG